MKLNKTDRQTASYLIKSPLFKPYFKGIGSPINNIKNFNLG